MPLTNHERKHIKAALLEADPERRAYLEDLDTKGKFPRGLDRPCDLHDLLDGDTWRT